MWLTVVSAQLVYGLMCHIFVPNRFVIKNDKCFYSFGRCRQKKKPSGMNGGHLNEVIKWERPKEVG